MAIPLTYPLAGRKSLSRWRDALLHGLPVQADGTERYRLHLYDSFDWRLFRAEKILQWHERDSGSRLCLCSSRNAGTALSIPLARHPPRFATELPRGRLQRSLARLLGVRALLPLATLDTRSLGFRLTDNEGKTRARLFLEQYWLPHTGGGRRALGKWLRLAPLQGYAKDAEQLAHQLEQVLGLQQQAHDLLNAALSGTHRTPGDYASSIDIPLETELRADAAMRRILLVLLDAMETNESGTIDDLDTEFLHDFRVAVRRSRSALGQMKRVFPPRVLQRYRDEFAWLGAITGPGRDLDVYLLKFAGYRELLPDELRADLRPLHDFLAAHRELEYSALRRELTGKRYRTFKRQWRRYLESSLPQRPAAADARLTIGELAPRRTWRMYRRVLKEGRAIKPQSPAQELHELRKSCKKLRYLMEFFQRLYPAAEVRAMIKILKKLQDNLGDFQDLEVQTHALTRFSKQMNEEGTLAPQTGLAIETLRDTLEENMQSVRNEFENRFRHFDTKSHRKRFARLFHPADGE